MSQEWCQYNNSGTFSDRVHSVEPGVVAGYIWSSLLGFPVNKVQGAFLFTCRPCTVFFIYASLVWYVPRTMCPWTICPTPPCTDKIPKIRNKYSLERNCAASIPISTFMFLWAIYIQYSSDRSAYSAAGKWVGWKWEYIQWITHRRMNVTIRTEAAQLLFLEYINSNFFAVRPWTAVGQQLGACRAIMMDARSLLWRYVRCRLRRGVAWVYI